jgi:hypothetical protein
MQRMALCARKIMTFLKGGIGSKPVPIYWCAAADAQAVSPLPITSYPKKNAACAILHSNPAIW